ncbi:MAG: hypothetical protein ABFD63_12120 [Smithella sp.]|jgi:hypothetical protein
MNIGELLGAMVQTGMSPSSGERIKNSLGGGNAMDSLAGMLGKSAGFMKWSVCSLHKIGGAKRRTAHWRFCPRLSFLHSLLQNATVAKEKL